MPLPLGEVSEQSEDGEGGCGTDEKYNAVQTAAQPSQSPAVTALPEGEPRRVGSCGSVQYAADNPSAPSGQLPLHKGAMVGAHKINSAFRIPNSELPEAFWPLFFLFSACRYATMHVTTVVQNHQVNISNRCRRENVCISFSIPMISSLTAG